MKGNGCTSSLLAYNMLQLFKLGGSGSRDKDTNPRWRACCLLQRTPLLVSMSYWK